jgi:hypothetical protein
MNNPYFRATLKDKTKVDVNLLQVQSFHENTEGTVITFADGAVFTVEESAQTIRGRTRKAWPDAASSEAADA